MPHLDDFFSVYCFTIEDVDLSMINEIAIRDIKDEHVVISAILTDADVLVTGDKDFYDKNYGIEILTTAQFLSKYHPLS